MNEKKPVGPSPEFIKFMKKTKELMDFLNSYNETSEALRKKNPNMFEEKKDE